MRLPRLRAETLESSAALLFKHSGVQARRPIKAGLLAMTALMKGLVNCFLFYFSSFFFLAFSNSSLSPWILSLNSSVTVFD